MPNVMVLNDSGKVIKNGKFLGDVFKDARAAYKERKAEIKAIRTSSLNDEQTKSALNGLDTGSNDHRSPTASRRSSVQSTASTRRRPVPGSDRPELRKDSRRASHTSTHEHRERHDRREYHDHDRDRSRRREHQSRREHYADHETPRSPRSERGDYDYFQSSRSHRPEVKSPLSPKVHKTHGHSKLRFEDSASDLEDEKRGKELVRRKTDGIMLHTRTADLGDSDGEGRSKHDSRRSSYAPAQSPRPSHSRRSSLASSVTARPRNTRSASMSEMEMSLAYGDVPSGSTAVLAPAPEERELRGQITRLQKLLDEAHCMESSVKAMIESLAKNPDQLAAAALMLGEISTLVAKAGPAALTTLKASAPGVFALLAAPQFAIAAGVGVGVTVIALGSYKIIKRSVKKKKAARLAAAENRALTDTAQEEDEEDEEDELDADELQEIRSDISRVEVWRRGIADSHLESGGTMSVDGEYITPVASQKLIKEGRMKETDLKRNKSKREKKVKQITAGDDTGSVFNRGKTFIKDPNGLRSLFKKSEKTPVLPVRPPSTVG